MIRSSYFSNPKHALNLAGINKHISFHTARHSWTVSALYKGMRIEYVSRLTGTYLCQAHGDLYESVEHRAGQALRIFHEEKISGANINNG
jgi:site-specific recombinase XerD